MIIVYGGFTQCLCPVGAFNLENRLFQEQVIIIINISGFVIYLNADDLFLAAVDDFKKESQSF